MPRVSGTVYGIEGLMLPMDMLMWVTINAVSGYINMGNLFNAASGYADVGYF
jgi:hypothetical protein